MPRGGEVSAMRGLVRVCGVLAVLAAASTTQAADVAKPYLPPPAVVPAYEPPPCFATFHGYPDAHGPALTRHGPEAVPVIRFLRYPGGWSLNGRVRSVTTSPGASIELFKGRHFRKPLFTIGPGSLVNLKRPVVDSYRLRCPPVAVHVAPAPPPSHPAFK